MIEVRGLTKRYGDTTAVDNLTFEVRPGYVTGYLGPNGSGKSTTMRLVLGLDHADEGEARVNGRRYAELAWPLREVGTLLEARAFHPGRSAFDHVLAIARANAISWARVEEVLDMVGLLAASNRAGALSTPLTERERHVLALMAEGRSNAAIASRLVVSEGAVEKHVANIFAKLGLPVSDSDNRRVLAVLRYREN